MSPSDLGARCAFCPVESTAGLHEVTDHYEALRTGGEPVTCWRALSRARDRWALLKAAMVSGSPLPDPWER